MSKPSQFAHLHQHTAYSLLDGAARIKDLISWVKEVTPENPTIAITDHGNMHGVIEFYKTASSMEVKPIIGVEAYVTAGSRFEKKKGSSKIDGGYFHLTLLAKDFKGYQNLCKLTSKGWIEGFYSKPRVDHELLKEHSEGVIAMSGCLGAQIPRMLLDVDFATGEAMLQNYLEIYKDNFFIELQNHIPENLQDAEPKLKELVEQQGKLNPMLKELANKYGLGMVATNDGHYVKKEDAKAHEALLAIQTKTTLSDPKRFKFPCEEFYVKTPTEMAKAIPEAEYPSALANTMTVADMCNVELPIGNKKVYQMPEISIPEGRTLAEQLRVQTYEGLLQRYRVITEEFYGNYLSCTQNQPTKSFGETLLEIARLGEKNRIPKAESDNFDTYQYPHLEQFKENSKKTGTDEEALGVLERAEYELGVIIAMGFPDYFLIVADFINWAKNQGIAVGPGRGSGAGSIVAYALGITNIDPLEFDLLFERFLNPERVSMPDFDIDFSDVRRGEVIDYVRRKYGDEKVAHIATFGTMASKAAIKDAARVLEAPYADADAAAKLIPVVFGRSTPIAKAMTEVKELKDLYDGVAKEFMDVAMTLEGLTRHASVHAAGVIIARKPIQELAPVFKSSDVTVCQYDMSSIEDLGFLKMDFLGLRTLSLIEAAVKIVKESREIELNPDEFPANDPETMALLGQGKAAGVFQFEGGGMVDTLKRLKPNHIEDLIAVSALYRPGPMENIPTYIRRHHGTEKVQYKEFPNAERFLKPILEKTYGIPVYQEQIMQIAQAVAGYSLGEADLLRRCLSGSTQVIDTKTGKLTTLKDIAKKPTKWQGCKLFSLDLNNQKITTAPITEVHPNGIKGVWEVITKTNRKIRATDNHLFYTLLGWQKLKDFKVGDSIALAKTLPIKNTSNISEDQIKIAAYLIGDGYLPTESPSGSYFCNTDLTLITDFNECVENLFGKPAPVDFQYRVNRKPVGYARVGFISNFNKWVDKYLKRALAKDKEIPSWVYQLSKEQLQLFLGTLWSTDGSFDTSIGHTDYTSTSIKLIQQIQHLLLRLGIVALFNQKNSTYKNKPHVSYRAQITGRDDVIKFYELIQPYLSQAKQAKAEVCYEKILPKAKQHSKHSIPPQVIIVIAEAKKVSCMTWDEIDRAVGAKRGSMSGGLNFQAEPTRYLSRHRVYNFAKAFQDERLESIAKSEIFWDKIASIEYIGKEEVFDLSIEGTHNFVANDFIVHNCMGKKKVDEMEKQRVTFLKGSAKNNIPKDEAEGIFNLLEKFANYGFNRSHAAAYGALSYQTAYLKTHYPTEFTAALLTVERANSDKVAEYVTAAKSIAVSVLSPDINESGSDFTPVGQVVRFGLYGIKNVGDSAVEHILSERRKEGKFKSLHEFCQRVDGKIINKRAVEHLIKAGAFDDFDERHIMLANYEAALKWGSAQREQSQGGQLGLFAVEEVQPPTLIPAETLGKLELLKMEKDALGLYISDHPMNSYPGLVDSASCKLEDLEEWYKTNAVKGKARALLAGIMQNVVKRSTKSGKMMARFELTDTNSSRELLVFSRVYEEVVTKLAEDVPVVVVIEISPEGEGSWRFVVEKLIRWDTKADLPEIAIIEFALAEASNENLEKLRSHIDGSLGVTPLHLKVTTPEGIHTIETNNLRISANDLTTLEESFSWLKSKVAIDRSSLLKTRNNFRGKKENKEESQTEVPF